MNANVLSGSLNAFWGLAYLAIAYFMIRRREERDPASNYLIVYSFTGFFVQSLLFLVQMGWLSLLPADVLVWFPYLGAALLILLFLAFTEEFLEQKSSGLWLNLGGVWLGMMLVWVGFSSMMPVFITGALRWHTVGLLLLLAGWVALLARAAYLIYHGYHQSQQLLRKNRCLYWALVLILITLGDILLFAGAQVIGSAIHLMGILIATYVILVSRVADPQQVGQRALGFLVITLIQIVVYALGFVLLQILLGDEAEFNILSLGVALAIVIVLLVNPFLERANRWVSHKVLGIGYDLNNIVREYSQGISNIVDLQRLAETSLEQIQRALSVREGCVFFLVDQEKDLERTLYRLQPIKTLNANAVAVGRLQANNPVSIRFCTRQDPLLHYDFEVGSEFKEMADEERQWLAGLNADVFVPICGQGKWIGLLALGKRKGGIRYLQQDLSLLSTLADQTVAGLQNARLVSDLNRVNADLEKTSQDLAKANENLHEIDRMKSSFIGVITHELRTPLASVGFALQIFEMYGLNHLGADQREQYQQIKTSYQMASRLIENLITFASFLNNQVKLNQERMNVRDLLREVLLPLKTQADEKGLEFKVEIIGEIPPLYADRKLIANAMYQLVQNAIKFTNSGGKVGVSCGVVADALCFEVRDTGIGIPPERLQEMWNEFSQMVDPLKRGVEGLGLGLALVKHIVAAHGGDVWTESQVGSGSLFGFQVPLISARQSKRVNEIFRRRTPFQR